MKEIIRTTWIICVMLMWAENSLGQPAGRIYSIGDKIDQKEFSLKKTCASIGINKKKTYVLVFTKENQQYSQLLFKEFFELFKDISSDSLTVINFHNGKLDSTILLKSIDINDSSFIHYSKFGLKVYPSTFMLNNDQVILAYFPGYNQSTQKNITEFLSGRHPSLFKKAIFREISKERRKQRRKEALIKILYDKGKYDLVLMELSKLDSLSNEEYLFLGYTLLRKNEVDSARTIVETMGENVNMRNYYNMGLGLIEYQIGNYSESLKYFNIVSAMKDMHRVHYWRGMAYKHLGDFKNAAHEFEKSSNQANRRTEKTFLP